MCGILGVVHRDPSLITDRERLIAARDTLTHRGPDEAGLWIAPGVALGHRRLKVQDLTHGQQPMLANTHGLLKPRAEAGSVAEAPDQPTNITQALIYNGELYNHPDLRQDLQSAGQTFTSTGDTETLFALLNAQGQAALPQLDGMFAFAHWQHTDRKLLLVRDRLGQKPLYWHDDGNQLVFASELKALLHFLDRKFDIDPAALDEFFTRGYVLSPRTIFQGIHKLPAGCSLKLDAESWSAHVEPWWDIEPTDVSSDFDEAVEQLDELLTAAVRKRLIADVPLGCLLSGGIDSSLITAIAAKESAGQIDAFSIGFDESADHNELPFAEMVANHVGCRWTSKQVRGGDFLNDLDDALSFFDEPFGNFTVIAQRKLAQLCREQLTVVLSGTGGDEFAAGYPGRYQWASQLDESVPRHQHTPAVDRLNAHLDRSSFVGYRPGRADLFNTETQHAINAAHCPIDAVKPYWNTAGSRDPLNTVLYADAKTNLPDYLVTIEERMAMSASLESRNPLLDRAVVNHLMAMPSHMKIQGNHHKLPLLKLCEKYLPRETWDRPKRGFTPPLALWMAQQGKQVAQRIREAELDAVLAPAWLSHLDQGQFDQSTLMPAYYTLALATWTKHYGQYINHWPAHSLKPRAEAGSAAEAPDQALTSSPPKTTWHHIYQDRDPAALANARWFTQALGNIKTGSKLKLTGDPDGLYQWLAEQAGYQIDNEDHTAHVMLGLDAVQSYTAPESPTDVLMLIPFALPDQPQVQAVLQTLQSSITFQGTQGIQTAEGQAILIARGQTKAAGFSFDLQVA